MPDAAPPLLALHLVAAQLRPDATDAAIAHAVERARALACAIRSRTIHCAARLESVVDEREVGVAEQQ